MTAFNDKNTSLPSCTYHSVKINNVLKCTVQYLHSKKSTVHGNSIFTDDRRQITHFKSFLLPDVTFFTSTKVTGKQSYS